ncbi:unnamed protein product [Clavelina lepadiformis]|uniref:Protein odr-4 homolog n=1 Tax=Clavelina lepadiformis TaxID=159417 RepID=A0ABP0H2Z3_CLALP
MGKSVLVEDHIAAYLQLLVKNKSNRVGVIVGKIGTQRDYVVKLICCPFKESSSNDQVVDSAWVAATADEVSHMLPGGLHVMGIFAVAPMALSKDVQNGLRQALYSTHKLLNRLQHSSLKPLLSDQLQMWTLLHVDLDSGKTLLCRQYDMNDKTCAGKPAEWKITKHATTWIVLKTLIKVNTELYINLASYNVEQQLKGCVSSYCHGVANALVEVDGRIPTISDLLELERATGSAKSKKTKFMPHSKLGRTLTCQLYFANSEATDETIKEFKPLQLDHLVKLSGSIFACAYIPAKTTVMDGIKLLKADAILSLLHRCTLLSEELQENKQNLVSYEKYISFPKRVAFTDSGKPDDFLYFDYVFPGEVIDDSVARIKETFDTILDPGMITDNIELFAPVKNENIETIIPAKEASENHSANSEGSFPYGSLLAAGAALLSAAIAYLSLSD